MAYVERAIIFIFGQMFISVHVGSTRLHMLLNNIYIPQRIKCVCWVVVVGEG